MNAGIDRIELLLPFKAEYVSVARLTVSGIANRIGFDIEVIEDIKVSVSEVCSKLVRTGSKTEKDYRVVFDVFENKLDISFWCEDKSLKCIFKDEDDGLGVSIMTALMDDVELCTDSGHLLRMSKTLKGNK